MACCEIADMGSESSHNCAFLPFVLLDLRDDCVRFGKLVADGKEWRLATAGLFSAAWLDFLRWLLNS